MVLESIKTKEEMNHLYKEMSKTNIDNFIVKNDYRKALSLLILVLERLDNNEKV